MRFPQDVCRSALLDDASVPQDKHAVGDGADEGEIVGDEEEAHAVFFLQAAEECDDFLLHTGVECRGRFVTDEDVRGYCHRACDGGALTFAAADLVRVPRGVGGGEFHFVEEGGDAVIGGLLIGGAEVMDGLADRCTDAAARVERAVCVLKHHLDVAAELSARPARRADDVFLCEQDASLRRGEQSREELCCGGLAAAARTDETEAFALVQREGHGIDCLCPCGIPIKVHGDVVKAQKRGLCTGRAFRGADLCVG